MNFFGLFSKESIKMPEAQNLQKDGELSRAEKRPIVLYVSASWCDYCEVLKQEILNPVMKSGEYQDVIFRNAILDSTTPFYGFDGKKVDQRDYMYDRYKTEVTPTLVFVDPDGNETYEKIAGYANLEFYSFYLEQGINATYMALGSDQRIRTAQPPKG